MTHHMPGHLCWVMPGLVGASYGRVSAEEAAMTQQSPGPAGTTGLPLPRACVRLFTRVVAVLRAVVWIGLADFARTAVG
jgi:hypothetical protein